MRMKEGSGTSKYNPESRQSIRELKKGKTGSKTMDLVKVISPLFLRQNLTDLEQTSTGL